jgi:hypothetical protein
MQALDLEEPRVLNAAPMVKYLPDEPTVRHLDGALVRPLRSLIGLAEPVRARPRRLRTREGRCILSVESGCLEKGLLIF